MTRADSDLTPANLSEWLSKYPTPQSGNGLACVLYQGCLPHGPVAHLVSFAFPECRQ